MLLYGIILLEGFVTISLEILTIRQLLPIMGSSVIVTSLIIGIFLLFLALGYRSGGQYTNNYLRILQKNFTIAALGLGIGLSYTFIELFFQATQPVFPQMMLAPLCLYLLCIVAPIVFCLGQTVPIVLNLWREKLPTGKIGGKVLYLSTIGSFLGATLTALILLNYFGVAWSVFINFCILTALVLSLMEIKTQTFMFISIITLGAVVYQLNVNFEKNMFIATNNYSNFQVRLDQHSKTSYDKFLISNNHYHSCINEKNQGCLYIEKIKKILFNDLKITRKKILVLGAGGFTLSAENTYHNQFTYVDIDKSLPDVIRSNFRSSIEGKFIDDDARHYIHTTTDLYDVIINDVYNGIAIPTHLVTQEYFAEIKSKLSHHGLAVFNVIANTSLQDNYSKHMDNTIRSVFKNCMATPLQFDSRVISNIIYVCVKSVNEGNNDVYTDDLNRADSEYFKLEAA